MLGEEKLFQTVARAFGFENALPLVVPEIGVCYQERIDRIVPGGEHTTVEQWLIAVLKSPKLLTDKGVHSLVGAAGATQATHVLIFTVATVDDVAGARLRAGFQKQGADILLLSGPLAEAVAIDIDNMASGTEAGFSFTRLRRDVRRQVEAAPWHALYQAETLAPPRLLPRHEGAPPGETDLAGALAQGSFLLLAPPGAGKTTALLQLARMLCERGGRTAVHVPLGAYEGDMLGLICEHAGVGATRPTRVEMRALLTSGALVVMLDGLNEVQEPGRYRSMIEQLEELTAEGGPTARSRWIVTGRPHDYEASQRRPTVIERRRWNIEPLDEARVFAYLRDAMGEKKALDVWKRMDAASRDAWRTPLLLSMVATLSKKQVDAPLGRGQLYRAFLEHMLTSDDARGIGARARLAAAWRETQANEGWLRCAYEALTVVASAMEGATFLPRPAALAAVKRAAEHAEQPEEAGQEMYSELLRRGVLRRRGERVSFAHHTFQEYAIARRDMNEPAERLIPPSGVPPERRVALRLTAGLRDDPQAFVNALLKPGPTYDLSLAMEIAADAAGRLPRESLLKLAGSVLDYVLRPESTVVGAKRTWARWLVAMTDWHGILLDDLVTQLVGNGVESQEQALLHVYRELGDVRRQRIILDRQMAESKEVPAEMLFDSALVASAEGNSEEAIRLYTQYMRSCGTSQRAAALHNRGLAYQRLGRIDEALRDFEASLAINDWAPHRVSLAAALRRTRSEEALKQARRAVSLDPSYWRAHAVLADILAPSDPDAALAEYAIAVEHAYDDERRLDYLRIILPLQEKLGRAADALATLTRMLALAPTDPSVPDWRRRITEMRRQLAGEHDQKVKQSEVFKDPECTLPELTATWLRAAAVQFDVLSGICFLAHGKGIDSTVVWILPQDTPIRAESLDLADDVLHDLPQQSRRAVESARRRIFVAISSDIVTVEAQARITALRASRPVALVTGPEVRDAALRDAGRMLFDNAPAERRDPFELKGVVKSAQDFFARREEIKRLKDRLSNGESFGLFGIHKVGKSSLLRQVRVALREHKPAWTVVASEIDGHWKDAARVFRGLLQAVGEEVKGTEVKLSVPDGEISAEGFFDMLLAYQRDKERNEPGHRLVLIVDEYHLLLRDSWEGGLDELDDVLSAWKRLVDCGWMMLVPCGRTAALTQKETFGAVVNPFFDSLVAEHLMPMSRDDHHEMMQGLASGQAKVRFGPSALDAVFAETGGHPGVSRDLGTMLFDRCDGEVSPEQVSQVAEKMARDGGKSALVRGIYRERMTPLEQEVAVKVAHAGHLPYEQVFSKGASNTVRLAVRDALENLVSLGLLMDTSSAANGGAAVRSLAHRIGLLRRAILREEEGLGR